MLSTKVRGRKDRNRGQVRPESTAWLSHKGGISACLEASWEPQTPARHGCFQEVQSKLRNSLEKGKHPKPPGALTPHTPGSIGPK